MSYKKVEEVLPVEIIELIQNYIDGEYIYIPRKSDTRRDWGTNTNTRQEINERNNNIFRDYKSGMKVFELANKYYLSEKSIQRIIYKVKSIA